MWGFGGEPTEPGEPIDIIEGEVTDEDGECRGGEWMEPEPAVVDIPGCMP